MNSADFFSFSSQLIDSNFQAEPVDEHISGYKLIKSDYVNIKFPIIFKQEMGKNLHDVLDTSFVGFYLISNRLRSVLLDNDITGWKTFDIQLYDKNKNQIYGFYGFSITGSCGPISYRNSEIIEKRLVSNGPICKFYKGLAVDRWDGADFFTPDGTYQTFITARTADVLKKHKITNVHLRNLAEIEKDVHSVPKKHIS